MADIRVVIKDPEEGPCKYCDLAKQLLTDKGLRFRVEIKDAFERDRMYKDLGLPKVERSVPQIWIDDQRVVGGYAGLKERLG